MLAGMGDQRRRHDR